ncbi:hypothetical protein DERP_013942 [Dermatophagoides pteronyssinus]|uniref:Uncharacterized protein n=1 Tax=Dermatophagoides pteronyssinus TaxID=6956 RepID=A0ABQ8JQN8_DERPT|nr:hypothetical protein DERP_013942 [Dermatophagoides pteronyssinus]
MLEARSFFSLFDLDVDHMESTLKVKQSILQKSLHQLYRHRFLVTLPPFLFYCIYSDYSRTQEYKRKKAQNSS